jgi:hypothetical protein
VGRPDEETPTLFPYHGDWASVHFGERRGARHVTKCYPVDTAETRTYTFSSLGFRGEEFDPAAHRTVFACGGSTTVGVGVSDEDVWTEEFKIRYAALHRCAPGDVNVLNFSQGAASADYTVRTLLNQCSRFEPDLVIAHLSGGNARTEWFDDEDHLSLGPWMVDPESDDPSPELATAHYTYYTPQLGVLNALKNVLLLQSFCRSRGIPLVIAWSDFTATVELAREMPVCRGLVELLDSRNLFEPRDAVDRVPEADHPGPRSHRLFAAQLLDMLQLERLGPDSVLRRTEELQVEAGQRVAVLPIDRRFTLGPHLLSFLHLVDGEAPVGRLVETCFGRISTAARDRLLDSLRLLVRFGILHLGATAADRVSSAEPRERKRLPGPGSRPTASEEVS